MLFRKYVKMRRGFLSFSLITTYVSFHTKDGGLRCSMTYDENSQRFDILCSCRITAFSFSQKRTQNSKTKVLRGQVPSIPKSPPTGRIMYFSNTNVAVLEHNAG